MMDMVMGMTIDFLGWREMDIRMSAEALNADIRMLTIALTIMLHLLNKGNSIMINLTHLFMSRANSNID